MSSDSVEHIQAPSILTGTPETGAQTSICRYVGPGIAPNEHAGEAAVGAPERTHEPTLIGQAPETKQSIADGLPRFSDLSALARTCRELGELAKPSLAQGRARNQAAKARNSEEVGQAIEVLHGLDGHERAEPLVALGYAIADFADAAERTRSMARWREEVRSLGSEGWALPARDVNRIEKGSSGLRPQEEANRRTLQDIGERLRKERYGESDIQLAVDAVGHWMHVYEVEQRRFMSALGLHMPMSSSASPRPIVEMRALGGFGPLSLRPRMERSVQALQHFSRTAAALPPGQAEAAGRHILGMMAVRPSGTGVIAAGLPPDSLRVPDCPERGEDFDLHAPATRRAVELLQGYIDARR